MEKQRTYSIDQIVKILSTIQPSNGREIQLTEDFIYSTFCSYLKKANEVKIEQAYDEGFHRGIKQNYHFSPTKMTAVSDTIKTLQQLIKNKGEQIEYMTYGVEYFGWNDDVLNNEKEIQRAFDTWLKQGKELCKEVLGRQGEQE